MTPEATLFGRYRNDPIAFVKEVLHAEVIDEWQKDALTALTTHDRVAFIASKGVGKSCVEAWAACWWECTRVKGQVVCTSTTADNLRDGLWKEIGKWYAKSKLMQALFDFTASRVSAKEDPVEWWVAARSWRKDADASQQANTLAGIHGDAMLYIGDEAGDYPAGVLAAAEAMMANVTPGSGREAKILLGGNPVDPSGPLYDISTRNRHLWHIININGDPDDPKRSPRVSIEWAKQQIEQYGRDNPYVLVNVFGRFPPTGFNTLLSPDEVRTAMERHITEDKYEYAQKRLGVDVARFGDDATCLFPRQGLLAHEPVIMRGARTNDIAARVANAKAQWGCEVEFVDGTGGYGAGVVDSLLQSGANPMEVNFAAKASDEKFYNVRAEMWWRMAEWVKRGGVLPNDSELARELTAPTYTFKGGKILLEEKAQVKARLGHSCDRADSLALTFFMPDQPANVAGAIGRSTTGEVRAEWDPYESDE